MKQLLFLLVLAFSGNCQAQLSDASLQIDTSLLETPCDCHAAVILNMKETIFILEEFKRLGKEEPHVSWAREEVSKRDDHVYNMVYTRCKPIYKEQGFGHDCENYAEGELLNEKIIKLRAEVKLW